jgi:hypothetical protein
MTQLNTQSFPELAPAGAPTGMGLPQINPIDMLSHAELGDLMEFEANDPVMTPVQRDLERTYGKQGLGLASSSFTGYLGDWIGRTASKWMFDDQAFDIPLNLTDDVSKSGGINYSENVLDNLVKMVEENNVPWEQWGYIFEAPTLGDFRDRLERTVLGNPDTVQFGGNWGKAFGFASDTSGLLLLGAAMEPVLLAGTGLMGAASGAARVSRASEIFGRSVSVANEAAHFANNMSRLGFLGRSTAIAIGEESVVKGIQYATDPTFEGDAERVAWDYGMTVGGWTVLGGIFAKGIARNRFENAYNKALNSYVTPTGLNLVEWRGPLGFATSAMDRNLMEEGASRVRTSLANLADSVHRNYAAWATTAGGIGPILSSSTLSGIEKAAVAILWKMDNGIVGSVTNPETGRAIVNAIWDAHLKGAAKGGDATFWNQVADSLVGAVPDNVLKRMRSAAAGGRMPTSKFDDLFLGVPDMDAYKMVDELVEELKAGALSPETMKSIDKAGERSFAIALLREMMSRGFAPTTEDALAILKEFGDVVRNPPITATSAGPAIDEADLATKLVEVANRRLPSGNQIQLTTAAKNRLAQLASSTAVRLTAGGIKAGPGMPVKTSSGGLSRTNKQSARMLDDEVPILNRWTDTLPGPFKWMFNQSAGALTSQNFVVRLTALVGLNARRVAETKGGRVVAQGRTVTEETHHLSTVANSHHKKIMRNGFARFVLGKNPTDRVGIRDAIRVGYGSGRNTKFVEFNRRVAAQLASGKFDDVSDSVNEAAREIRKLYDNLNNAANKRGIRGFRNVKYKNYVPHHWNSSAIRTLLAHGQGRQSLIQLIKQSMIDAGVVDSAGKPLRQMILDNGKVFEFDDIDAAAEVFADVLLGRANQMDRAPLTETEEAVAKALRELKGPLKGDKAMRARAGKGRVNLNTNTSVNVGVDLLGNGRTDLSILDLIDTDQGRVFRDYSNSVLGAIGEYEMVARINAILADYGIMRPVRRSKKTGKALKPKPLKIKSLDELPALANKFASQDPERFGRGISMGERTAMQEIINAVRMIPVVRPETPVDLENISRIATTLSYLRSGGRFVFAQISEMYRIVGTYGLRAAIAEVPTMLEVVENWKNLGEGPKTAIVLLTDTFGIGVDRQLRNILRASPIDAERVGGYLAIPRQVTDRVATAFSDFEGLAPVTSLSQQMAASSALHHLLDVARNVAKPMDDATVRTWGLEPDQYRELINWVGANAQTYRRMGFTRIKGFSNYPPEIMDRLTGFVHRATVTRIQDYATRGDMHAVAFSWWGRLLLQFQTFTLKGVDNLMFQNLSRVTRGDAQSRMQVAREMAAVLAGAWTVKYALNYSDWWSANTRGDTEKANEIAERKLTAKASVLEAMNYVGDFYLPMMAFEKGYSTLVDRGGLSSDYRAREYGGYSIPILGQYESARQVSGDVIGSLLYEVTGNESIHRDITTSTLHKARTLLPFQNLWYLKHLFNVTEDNIAEHFELPEQQKARKR